MSDPAILCDFWYGRALKTKVDMLDDVLAASPLLRAVGRVRVGRALVLLALGRRYDAIIPDWYGYGRFFCVLAALTGRRQTVLFELIDFGARRGWLIRFLARHVLGPCLRRTVLGVQVMSRFECTLLAERYGMPPGRFHFVAFPLIWQRRDPPPAIAKAEGVVFSAGRGGCDWPTLFAAAAKGKWKLVVVCAKSDLADVTRLNANVGAEIHTDMPRAAYDALMARASVYIACLSEQMKSSGHIRIGHAIEAMVPAVVSNTRCMADYLIDGVTGAAVPPGDAAALAARVAALLADPVERLRLARSAFDHFRGYNKGDYFVAIDNVLTSCLEDPA